MEFSWSALWNITDETPDNCEMFLNFNGMKLFLDCLKVGPAWAATHPTDRYPTDAIPHKLPMGTQDTHTVFAAKKSVRGLPLSMPPSWAS